MNPNHMTFKPLFASIICCLLIFQFTSCQKDFSTTSVPAIDSTVTSKNDSTLLKLFVKLDTLHPAGQDTLYKMVFSYDNLKRLSTYDYYHYDSSNGVLHDKFHLKMEYNNFDTLPYKIFAAHQQNPQDDSYFFTFYEKGHLSYIKYINAPASADSIIVKTFYSGDSDITVTYSYPIGTAQNDTVHHKMIVINGNVVKDIEVSTNMGWFPYPGETYTYDNLFDGHKNPFKRIAFVFKLFNLYPYDPLENGSFVHIMAESKNNIIESKFNSLVYQLSDDNYYAKSYIYNANGLPAVVSYIKQLSQQNQFYAGRELYFYADK